MLLDLAFERCLPPCNGLYVDVERSPAEILEDQKAKNVYFEEQYKKYTRFNTELDGLCKKSKPSWI